MRAADVLEKLGRALAVVELEQGRLRVRALFEERPLTEETLALCREHKPELLAYLSFAQEADHLLLSSTGRLARAWPTGCQLEDERWDEAEKHLHEAYWSLDLRELQEAIRSREQLALELFAAFQKERTR